MDDIFNLSKIKGELHMKIKNEFINKNLIALCSAVSILGLFLPFVKFTAESSYSSNSVYASAFQAISGSNGNIISSVILIGPVLLIVMNYIKQLEKYHKTIAIAIPGACVLFEIISYFLLSTGMNSASDTANSVMSSLNVSVDGSTAPQIGFFILLLSYIATAIAGGITYHGLTLDKEGFEKVKAGSIGIVKMASEKASDVTHKVS